MPLLKIAFAELPNEELPIEEIVVRSRKPTIGEHFYFVCEKAARKREKKILVRPRPA
jgi:hypothetical protein